MDGKKAEKLAAIYLWFHGYAIKDKNYYSRFGEIDIIAQKKDTIIFVEVKARGEKAFFNPAFAVDIYKQRKILKTAQMYIYHNRLDDVDIRFDVVEIYKNRGRLKINHIQDAFGG